MDELDQQAKQFKFNAEQLEVVCDKLAHLSQDKRKAKKTYQEEHTKIAARLNHVSSKFDYILLKYGVFTYKCDFM